MALRDQVLDHAAAGRQVGDVELVDRRRHDKHRVLVHLGGHRRVLDQLADLRPADDGARRDREVAADLERVRRHHRRHARRGRQVRCQRAQAARHAEPAGVDDRLPRLRADQRIVARRRRVDEVAHDEPDPFRVTPVEVRVVDERQRDRPGREVRLHQAPQERVAGPGRGPRTAGPRAVARSRNGPPRSRPGHPPARRPAAPPYPAAAPGPGRTWPSTGRAGTCGTSRARRPRAAGPGRPRRQPARPLLDAGLQCSARVSRTIVARFVIATAPLALAPERRLPALRAAGEQYVTIQRPGPRDGVNGLARAGAGIPARGGGVFQVV